MRFVIPIGQQKLKSVITEHNGEELTWDTTWYVKGSYEVEKSPQEIFHEINGYINNLPVSRQQAIFDAYKSIHNSITDLSYNMPGMNLVSILITKVKTLYDAITEDEILYWITRKDSDITLPSGVTNDYGDQSPEQTYLLSDHIGLVGLAMVLRMMIPIWGEFIRNYSDESETGFKEYTAMRLLLNAWPNSSKHRTRLLDYLTFLNKKEPVNITATYSGVGSVEKPEWLLSTVCVRRLPVAQLSNDPDNPRSKLVSSIYNFVTKNTYNTLERKFSQRMKDKHEMLLRSPEDKTSFTENYKIKEAISAGDLATLCAPFKNPTNLFNRIDSTVPNELYEICAAQTHLYETVSPAPHQVNLMQWIMGLGMTATGVESLIRTSFLQAMVGTQAILWHWGFPDLAALVTVKAEESNVEDLFTTDTKPRVPKEDIPKLLELYPHHQPISTRGDASTNVVEVMKAQKAANTAITAIDLVTAAIGVDVWHTYCPELLLSKTSNSVRRLGRKMLAPSDLKIQLSSLIIKINVHSEAIYKARCELRKLQASRA